MVSRMASIDPRAQQAISDYLTVAAMEVSESMIEALAAMKRAVDEFQSSRKQEIRHDEKAPAPHPKV